MFTHRHSKKIIHRSCTYIFLTLVGISMLLPLCFMLSTSLKQTQEVYETPSGFLGLFIPSHWKWDNYSRITEVIPFWRYYFNSIFVALITTVGKVITSALAAYGFARLTFPGRDKLFFCYLATMMIPGAVTMVPNFILLSALPDWLYRITPAVPWKDYWLLAPWNIPVGRLVGIDSYFALIAPAIFSAYGTFMLRQFFLGLPRELEEAAEVDGCGLFRIFVNVTVPLSLPALATLSIFTFLSSWSSFMWPLVVTNKEYLRVLPVGLQVFQGQNSTDWPLLMAASVLTLIPSVLIFLLGQRFFISGIQLGGVKG